MNVNEFHELILDIPDYENAIIRNTTILKRLMENNAENKKEIKRIQEIINKMNKTEENMIERYRLHHELGEILALFRNNSCRIKHLKRKFLNNNITG